MASRDLGGIEIHRFGLREHVMAVAERNNIRICVTLLEKSVVEKNICFTWASTEEQWAVTTFGSMSHRATA